MRLFGLGLAVGLAVVASAAAAEPSEAGRDPRTQVMWHAADRLWTGALPAQGCGPRAIEPTGAATLASPIRRAAFQRRGELIAELRGPKRTNNAALVAARSCAARAAHAAGLPVVLAAALEPWEHFQGSLAACLQATGAAGNLGSMTLWIDTRCDW